MFIFWRFVYFFKNIYLSVNLWIEASFMKAVNQTAGQCWGIIYPFSFIKVMEERVSNPDSPRGSAIPFSPDDLTFYGYDYGILLTSPPITVIRIRTFPP